MTTSSSVQSAGYRERNSTADRAIDILLCFDDTRLVLSARDVARHLTVSRSTAYRYLQSLTSSGLLEEHEGGGFRLGPRILQLGRLARMGNGLIEIARPVMRDLADHAQAAVLLTRRSGNAVVCLEREDAGTLFRISYEPGHVLPPNAGASATVLLAWSPRTEVDALLTQDTLTRFTDATVTDPEAIRERLSLIKQQGYAVSRGEVDPDVLGIAAPIVLPTGEVVAAISVVALAYRITPERETELVQAVSNAADEISNRLKLNH